MSIVTKTIAECTEVIPGVLEKKNSEKNLCVYDAVLPNQISPDGFIKEYGTLLRPQSDTLPFLKNGDVIIKRLNPDCAIVFDDEARHAIPSANLFVMRPKSDLLDSHYLAFLLENSHALNRISQRFGIGTAVSAVTINQIKNCEIPLPTLDQQKKIGALWCCIKKQKSLLQELIAENNLLLQSISEKLYQ